MGLSGSRPIDPRTPLASCVAAIRFLSFCLWLCGLPRLHSRRSYVHIIRHEQAKDGVFPEPRVFRPLREWVHGLKSGASPSSVPQLAEFSSDTRAQTMAAERGKAIDATLLNLTPGDGAWKVGGPASCGPTFRCR